ncbi:endolytic transglycosylase MltG [Clostridium ihumii]|uniref:endolytic transglycosylase MltG n=1 Tax=Clostridium ihumii TaxID=1470356 RepID=UPI00058E7BC2|nr:endolytic transglycosylase MltG [Clostridium ihumii]
MKKGIIIATFCLIGILIFGTIFYSKSIKNPFKTNDDFIVKVKEGDTLYTIIDGIDEDGILKNSVITKMYIKMSDNKPVIKPGTYNVEKDASLGDLLNILGNESLNNNNVSVTIPEGYDIDQIAKVLDEKGIISSEKFIKGVKEYPVPKYIKLDEKKRYQLEGFLFPDTYTFTKGVTAEEIIKTMNNRFNSIIKELTNKEAIETQNINDIVTMASIVEKEASSESERDIVSSVFYNRLNNKMKFQSCATVIYALGEHREKLYEKDLEVKSPYNTYLVEGLPVGPISNPGRASINAAINPKKTNYLFFVSNNDGTHFFTDNYEEFLKVKEKTQGF